MVSALLRSGTESRASSRLAERIWMASEGNPFVVVEAMRAIGADHVRLDDAALALPERVILDVAKGHQRYFGVRDAKGGLLPNYLTVVGTALQPNGAQTRGSGGSGRTRDRLCLVAARRRSKRTQSRRGARGTGAPTRASPGG